MFTKKMGVKLILNHISQATGWMFLATGYVTSCFSLLNALISSLRGSLTLNNSLPCLGIGFLWGVGVMLWNFDVRRKQK